jgi:hypothetical protein
MIGQCGLRGQRNQRIFKHFGSYLWISELANGTDGDIDHFTRAASSTKWASARDKTEIDFRVFMPLVKYGASWPGLFKHLS